MTRPTKSMHTVCRIVLNIAAVVSVGTSLVAAGASGLAAAKGFQAGLWQPVAGITDAAILGAACGICLSILKAIVALAAIKARGLPWSWVVLATVLWLVALLYLVATLVLAVLGLTADLGAQEIPFVVVVLSSVVLEVAAGTLPGLAATNMRGQARPASDEAQGATQSGSCPSMMNRPTSAATVDDVVAVIEELVKEQTRQASGQWITVSQRTLARRVGCSLSHASHLLHQLARDGVIDLQTRRRTRVRLHLTRVGRGTGDASGADRTHYDLKTAKSLKVNGKDSERSREHCADVQQPRFPRRADAASDQARNVRCATVDRADASAKTKPL